MKADVGDYIIQAVSRALDLLEQFQDGEVELGITDLSNRLNLQKNNVFRLVATLRAKNYIEINNSNGKYRLGIKTRALGQVASRQIDFANHARPFLDEIKQTCHEACYFSVIKDGHTCFLDGVESDLPVRVTQRAGSSRPLYCTAAGKVQLAFMDQQKQADLLSGLEMNRYTAHTIAVPEALHNELKRVAQQGYAIDDQEHEAWVKEIAAPVFDAQGVVIGALSILGPEMRLAGTRLENELLPLVCQSALRLSIALGYCRTAAPLTEKRKQPPKTKKIQTIGNKPYVTGALKTCC